MKKLVTLSVAVLMATVMFGQDTSTAKTGSQTGTGMDSIPPGNSDTSALGRGKWADSAKNKSWQDSAMNNANKNNGDTSGTGGSNTDSSSANNKHTDSSSATTTKVEDKVVMMNDKVYVVKNGDSTVLTDSIRLGSGAVVKSDAGVTFKDGSTTKLKNGQYIALTTPPPATTTTTTTTSENKSQADNSTSSNAQSQSQTDTSSTATKPVEDRVVMINDRVMVVKNGDSTLLDQSMKLQSGAVVMNDGSVTFKNGSKTKLKNGQFIAINTPVDAKKTKVTKATKTTKTTTTTKKKTTK